jgi:hypothetical protein
MINRLDRMCMEVIVAILKCYLGFCCKIMMLRIKYWILNLGSPGFHYEVLRPIRGNPFTSLADFIFNSISYIRELAYKM